MFKLGFKFWQICNWKYQVKLPESFLKGEIVPSSFLPVTWNMDMKAGILIAIPFPETMR